jgi:hypothetical protein
MSTILKIFRDTDLCESPRDWDNLGTMVCWHNRYSLGDKQPRGEPIDYIEDLVDQASPGFAETMENEAEEFFDRPWTRELTEQWDGYRNEKLWEEFSKHYVWLPLYLYDHGGITMSTGPFNCPWDSGQVGFIYMSREDVAKHFPTAGEEGAIKRLESEVEVYDQYLRGEVFFFVLEVDGEEENSCEGFYGDDWRTNGIADHVDIDQIDEVWYMEEHSVTTYEPAEVEELR